MSGMEILLSSRSIVYLIFMIRQVNQQWALGSSWPQNGPNPSLESSISVPLSFDPLPSHPKTSLSLDFAPRRSARMRQRLSISTDESLFASFLNRGDMNCHQVRACNVSLGGQVSLLMVCHSSKQKSKSTHGEMRCYAVWISLPMLLQHYLTSSTKGSVLLLVGQGFSFQSLLHVNLVST